MNPRHTLTGQLAGGFIESKLTLVLMIAALIFGIWAVLSTPREELHLEDERSVYKRADKALKRLTIAMYGATES